MHAAGISSRRLDVSHAFHSALIDGMLPTLARVAATLTAKTPHDSARLESDRPADARCPCAAVLVRARSAPVRFADGITALRELGCSIFIETGPGTTALASGQACLSAPRRVATLDGENARRRRDAFGSLKQLYLDGASIDWGSGCTRRPVDVGASRCPRTRSSERAAGWNPRHVARPASTPSPASGEAIRTGRD